MKRLMIIFIVFFLLNNMIFASENNGDFIVNAGIGFLYPIDKNENAGTNILGSLLLSSFSIGGGYHLNIIENIFSPGIYGDIHISFLSMLFNNDREIINDEDDAYFFIQSGIRLYNQFRFGLLDLQPFYGINFIFGTILDTIILNAFGISLTYNWIGLEYSYQIPFDKKNNDILRGSIHRIVFIFNLKKLLRRR